jgi:Mg2+-importing ATPase
MDRHALTAFITSITDRLRQRPLNSTAGSPASSVTLGEVAHCSSEEALQRLGSSATGLMTQEAEARLRSVGANEVAHEMRHTILGEIISRSMNPLNLLLLTLAAASYFIGDQRAAFVIAAMVLLSVSLGFFQEHRSTKAADALRRMVQTNATVRRQDGGTADGHSDVPIGQLVPGDIVLLSAGDMIPSDVRLISANDLFVNQSTLTGEAMPLEKSIQPHVGNAHRSISPTSVSWAALSSAASAAALSFLLAPGRPLARWQPQLPSSAC